MLIGFFSSDKEGNERSDAVNREEQKGCEEEQYHPSGCVCVGGGRMNDEHRDHRKDIVDDDMHRALCDRRNVFDPENKERKAVNSGKKSDSGVCHKQALRKFTDTVHADARSGALRSGGGAERKNGGPKKADKRVCPKSAQAAFKQGDLLFFHYYLTKQAVFSESASGATDATITHSILCSEVIFSTLQTKSSKAVTSSPHILRALSMKISVMS